MTTTTQDWTVDGIEPSRQFQKATQQVLLVLEEIDDGEIVDAPNSAATLVVAKLAEMQYRPANAVGRDWTMNPDTNRQHESGEFYCCVSSAVGAIQRTTGTLRAGVYTPTAVQILKALVQDNGLMPPKASAA